MSKFNVGDIVKVIGLNSITRNYGDSTLKRGLIGRTSDIEYISTKTDGTLYATINGFNFDFDDLELDFIISKDKSYKNSSKHGTRLKYLGNAFISESGIVVVADNSGKVTGSSYKGIDVGLDFTIIEVEPIVLPEMYVIEDSSTIASLGYDMVDKLYVKFINGSIYEYTNVTIQEFHKALSAKSTGTFFSEYIRNKKEFNKVS